MIPRSGTFKTLNKLVNDNKKLNEHKPRKEN